MLSLDGNDFSHYTNSNVLLLLPHTGYALHSVEKLLLEYGIAPLSGEIHLGGSEGLANDMALAFAQLTNTYWPRPFLLESYGKAKRNLSFFDNEESLLEPLKGLFNHDFSDVLVVILKMLQQQTSRLPTISIENRTDIEQKLTIARDRVARRLIMSSIASKFFQLDKNNYKHKSEYKGIRCYYDVHAVRQNLDQIPLDFFELATERQFEIAKNIFSEFFVMRSEKSGAGCNPGFFRGIPFEQGTLLLCPTEENLWRFLNTCLGLQREHGTLNEEQQNHLVTASQEIIRKLDDYLALILNTLDGKQPPLDLSPEQKNQIDSPFPIAFFVSHTMQKLMQPTQYEFRAEKSLTLGSDITIMGVCSENQAQLMEFLRSHKLEDKVSVIDIESTPEHTIVFHNYLAVSETASPITHQFRNLSLKSDNPLPPVSKEEILAPTRQSP